MTYADQLRNPRWQKRRLEIMALADWKCTDCKSGEVTLNVHHRIYRRGAAPWEYTDAELVCLCEKCHLTRHLLQDALSKESDIALEEAIEGAAEILNTTTDRDTRCCAAHVMAELIAKRSPSVVERMEVARGLRA